MKLKNRLMHAMLFAGVVALSSCEKNNQEEMDPTLEQAKIAQVLVDSNKITSYNYNGNDVSQINHLNEESGELESVEKLIKDASGKVVKVTSHAANNNTVLSEKSFSYDSKGQLANTVTNYYTGGKVVYSSYTSYKYNSESLLEKKSVHEGNSKDGQLKSYTTYQALPNGNYAQEQQYVIDDKGNAVLFSTTSYSYDTNRNPFFGTEEPGKASSQNNVISSTSAVHNSKKTYAYSYNYQYDKQGNPTSQTVVSPSGKREQFTYVYSK
jgi:hypothetical protein